MTMPNQHQLRKTQKKNPYNEHGITTCYAKMEYFEEDSRNIFHYEGEFNSRHSIPHIGMWIKSKSVSFSLDNYEEVFGDVSRYEIGNIEKCIVDFKRPDDWIDEYVDEHQKDLNDFWNRGICTHDVDISRLNSLRLQ